MGETEDYDKSATPMAHATTHENGGSDEISVAALSGQLADAQPSTWALVSGKPSTFPPDLHKTSHQDGGTDEISVQGLSGLLADDQHVLDAEVTSLIATTQPAAHKTSHQDGGSDEISVAGLSGQLADSQTPLAHKTSHQDGGADEISIAGLLGTPQALTDHVAASDPHTQYQKESEKDVAGGYAALDGSGNLLANGTIVYIVKDSSDNTHLRERTFDEDMVYFHRNGLNDYVGFILVGGVGKSILTIIHQDAVTGIHGVGASTVASAANIETHRTDAVHVLGQPPSAHKTSHQDGGADEISVQGLSGLLADPQTPIALPKFSAHKNGTNQTGVQSGVYTKVTFPTEEYDDGSTYDAPNSKWVPGIVGKGHISACITFPTLDDGNELIIVIYKNGSNYKRRGFIVSGTGVQSTLIACDVLVDNVADYFEIYCFQISGFDKYISGDTSQTWFMGHMLV